MIIALTHHNPEFLKATYSHPSIELTDHERHIPSGRKYISWDGQWRVWKMSPERVPIPCGRFRTLNTAIIKAKQ